MDGSLIIPLLLGSITSLTCLGIQLLAALIMLRHLGAHMRRRGPNPTFAQDFTAVGAVMLGLFVGHLLQIAIWATLFRVIGQFSMFTVAFYHSAVNFATLGYGDIVMDEKWRLLGALEAGNGVFMFGLSTGAMLAVMNHIYAGTPMAKPQHDRTD